MKKDWTNKPGRGRAPITTKQCTLCGRTKNIDSFSFVSTRNYYVARCKPCMNQVIYQYQKKAREVVGSQAWWRRRYEAIQKGAKVSQKQFRLSLEQFIELKKSPCYYCSEIFQDMTVDRIDNDEGYNIHNCVSACHTCNRLKGAVSIGICRKVLEHVDNR